MSRLLAFALALTVAAIADSQAAARADTLVTDLSSHLISITSGFTGTDLLLFGAAAEGGDIVVVVRGPAEDVVVRRKSRVGGIWVNRRTVPFEGVPGYFAVNTSRPIEDIASESLRIELGLGSAYLNLTPAGPVATATLDDFRRALIRNKADQDLFREAGEPVAFVGDTLFRTRIEFPANAPAGIYSVDVFLFRDRALIHSQSTPLFITKAGFEQAVFELAHDQPAVYGLIAIVIAIAGGWLAAAAFRRI
jgi:uncharacterized protein (TIGR02186 family)